MYSRTLVPKHLGAVKNLRMTSRVTVVDPLLLSPTGLRTEPSRWELLLLVLTSGAIFIGACSVLHGWRSLTTTYGDNEAYVSVADAISHWDFHNVGIQHFMGYPYFIAVFSTLFRIPPSGALWMIAWSASLVSIALIEQSFGTWVAAYFALTNFAWLQLSFLGGSEPLALALGLGAFWMFRRHHWIWSSILASLSVTVRPLMIFVLVGIGLTLLGRKKYLQFVLVFAISIAIGLL